MALVPNVGKEVHLKRRSSHGPAWAPDRTLAPLAWLQPLQGCAGSEESGVRLAALEQRLRARSVELQRAKGGMQAVGSCAAVAGHAASKAACDLAGKGWPHSGLVVLRQVKRLDSILTHTGDVHQSPRQGIHLHLSLYKHAGNGTK